MRRAKKINQIITHKDIFLKLLTPDDVTERYAGWMNDPQVTKFIENRDKSNTVVKLKRYVKKMYQSPNDYLFGIFLKSSNEHIGNIKIGSIHPKHLYADVGILVGEKKYWGSGYGTQAIEAVSKFAFSKLKLNKLFAAMVTVNPSSYHAFKRAGFELAGTLKKHAYFNYSFVDTLIVEKLRVR